MFHGSPFIRPCSLLLIFAAVLSFSSVSAVDHQTVLYNFGTPPDASGPVGTLLRDAAGNFYGVSGSGGEYCGPFYLCGTVFELSQAQGGGWTETVLHSFGNGNDGYSPNGSLIMDAAGNLYGTTYSGGNPGGGTVYELSPDGHGGWTETVLHSFAAGNDGELPDGGLIMDAAGNLYGTTLYGGAFSWGTVYELSPNGGGWTETTLHSFNYSANDGHSPIGSLVMDAAGNLYGTTYNGGAFCQSAGCGTVFEMSHGVGGWAETVLHSFDSSDGYGPESGLVMDRSGNLYGTTFQGGNLGGQVCAPFGCGVVFEISPAAGGGWIETTLYRFNGQPDAGYPQASLALDSHGNLLGTTAMAGTDNDGSVFELSFRQGAWKETLLYSFNVSGEGPGNSGVILDRVGDLYGLAGGGTNQTGIAYELSSPLICGLRCPSTEK